jgi:hypothetical protein
MDRTRCGCCIRHLVLIRRVAPSALLPPTADSSASPYPAFTTAENISRDSSVRIDPVLSAEERAMMRMVAVTLLVANFANVLCLIRYF